MKKRLLSLLLCALCVLTARSEVTYILNEGFESGIPATWTQEVKSANSQLWIADTLATFPNGAFAGTGRAAFRNTTGLTQSYVTRLITPVFSLPYGSQYELKFAYAAAADGADVDSLTVFYSTDGNTWTKHTGFGEAQNSWTEVSLDLIGNGNTYQLAFEGYDRLGHGIVLDAVRVLKKSECADIENFAAEVHANSVDLTWSGDFGATYQLIVDTVDHALASLDPAAAYLHYEESTSDAVTVSGLQSQTKYYAFVRSLCSDNETGVTAWQRVEFTTAIGYPFVADFSTAIPAGWQNLYGKLSDAYAGTLPQENTTTSYKWMYTTNTTVTGKAHLYGLTHYVYSGGSQYTPAWLVTPAIDIASVPAGTAIELCCRLGISSSSSSATDLTTANQATTNFHILVSTDGGQTWEEANAHTYPGTEYLSSMRRIRVNLSEFVGVTSSLTFAFVAEAAGTSVYFHLDDVKLQEFDAQCGDVQTLKVNASDADAVATWTVNGKNDVVLQLSAVSTFSNLLVNDTLTANTYTFSNLTPSTKYYARVKQQCEDAEWVVKAFETGRGVPYVPTFTSTTFPSEWERWNISSDNLFCDTCAAPTTYTSGGWVIKNNYAFTPYHFKANVFGTAFKHWVVSPAIYLNPATASNVQLAFDLALTAYSSSSAVSAPAAVAEDRFWVVVSEDGGDTWERANATLWSADANDNPDYDYNAIPYSGQHYTIDLTRYMGHNIKIAFGAESWITGGDNDLHVANIAIKAFDPACVGLEKLLADVDVNDAVLSWTIGGTTHEAKVQIATDAAFTTLVADTAISGVDTFAISGLTANTKYYARAWQNCAGFTAEDALTLNFKTHCEASSIPYTTDFESDQANGDPECWTIVRTSGNYPLVNNGVSYAHGGTKALYYGTASAQNVSVAALPAFVEDVTGLELTFWLRAYSASCTNTLEVGVMDNPLDASTFVRVASFAPKSTTYEEQTVGFNAYQGTGKYIAFRNTATGNYGFCIDDVDVHVLPTCFAMGEVEVNTITGQGATLTFAPTNAANYQVVAATEAIDIDSLATAAVAAKVKFNQVLDGSTGSIVLNDPAAFTANTTFYIYVRGVCADEETGKWSRVVSFTTNCKAFTPAEFGVEEFNSDQAMQCWKMGFTTPGNSTSTASTVISYARRTSAAKYGNVLQLCKQTSNNGETTYDDGAYAITPEFAVGDTINKYQITFNAATYNSTSLTNVRKLTVAIVSDPSDLSLKEDIQTLNLDYAADSTSMKEYSVSFENYTGDYMGNIGRYVMFQSVANDSVNYVYIDNVRLEPISSCKKVNEIAVSAVTEEGATLSWTTTGADSYEVLVDTVLTKNVAAITAPVYTTVVSTNSAVVTGLEGNTQYYAYVRGICAEGDTALWSGHAAFKTECGAVTAFPWTENFDSRTVGDLAIDCWTNEQVVGSSYFMQVATSTSVDNSTKMFQLKDQTSGNITRVTLPYMEIPEANAYEFRMDMYRNNTYNTKLNEGFVILCESANGTDTIGVLPRVMSIANDYVPAESAAGWYTYSFTIPTAGGLHIVLHGISEYGSASYADNFEVRALPQCPDPKLLTVTGVSTTSVSASWNGTSDAYDVWVVRGNDTIASTQVTETSAIIEGLAPSTSYTLFVKGVCGENVSDVVSVSFKTAIGLPYVESLNSGLPSDWSKFSGLASDVFGGTAMTANASGWSAQTASSTTLPSGMGANMKVNIYGTACRYWMVTPSIDMSDTAMTTVKLTFDAAWTGYNKTSAPTQTSTDDKFIVAVSTDDGATWDQANAFIWANDNTGNMGTVDAIPAAATNIELDLSAFIGSSVKIGFYGESTVSGGDNDFHVANISLREMLAGCDDPTDVALTLLGQDTAIVTFAGDSAKQSVIRLATDDEFAYIAFSDTIAAGLTDTITGLAHGVYYYAQVQQLCAGDAKTVYVAAPNSILTPCDAVAELPWAVDFENVTALSPCWTKVKTTSTNYPLVSTTSKAICFYGGTSSNEQILALPEFGYTLSPLTFTMNYKASVSYTSDYGTVYTYPNLILGYMTALDEASFVALDTIAQAASATEYEYVLANVPADARYLALRYAMGSNSGYAYVYNMALDVTPTCVPVKSLSVSGVARRELDLNWVPKVPAAAYDVVISTTALTDSALNVAEKISVDTTYYHATGLTRGTQYYIYVRANCGDEDGASTWTMAQAKTRELNFCEDYIVANGTTTSTYAPVYGYYTDAEQKTQSIYPASMLTELVGQPIQGLHYYVTSGSNAGKWDNSTFVVRLLEVADETFTSATFNTDAKTQVYSGTLTANTTDDMVIEFDQPYIYRGGNLLIEFELPTASSYASVTFAAMSKSGASLYGYNSSWSGYTCNSHAYLPKVGFNYCVALDPCPAVETISHELTGDGTSSALIKWTASEGDYAAHYSVLVSDTMVTDFSAVVPQVDSIAALQAEVTGLSAYTDYYVYVQTHCDGEGQSDGSSVWSAPYSFKTWSACPIIDNLSFVNTGKGTALATWSAQYEDHNFVYVLSETALDAAALETAASVAVTDTFVALTGLELGTTYHLYVAHTCGAEGNSPFISAELTTVASCPAVANLHAEQTTANTVLVAWDNAEFGAETEWEVGVVGREAYAQHVFIKQALVIGLDPDMNYTVYVKAICSDTESSALATLDVHTPEAASDEKTLGSGSATSAALPVGLYYNYSTSEQIYTAQEIGTGGTITSLSFNYKASSAAAGRDITIYMKHVDYTDFATSTSWETVGSGDIVYSGTYDFAANSWNQIDLQTSFDYNGTDNLLIVVDENTGSYLSSGLYFATYSGVSNCALYINSDGTNLDPTNPGSTSGTRTSSKNQIKLGFEASLCPAVKQLKATDITINSATATWMPGAGEISWATVFSSTALDDAQLAAAQQDTLVYQYSKSFTGLTPDTDYHFYVRSLCGAAASDWKHLAFTTLPTCSAPLELEVKNVVDTAATLKWTNITEGFAGTYTVAFGPAAGFNLAADSTYTVYTTTADSLTFNDLTAVSSYSFAVQEICAVGDTSRWSEVVTFSTACGLIKAFPYVEDFNGLEVGTAIPECWDNSVGTMTYETYKWSRHVGSEESVCLRLNSYSATNGTYNVLETPMFVLDTALILSFDWKNPTGGNYSVYMARQNGDTITVAAGLSGTAWDTYEFNLAAYAHETVSFLFKGISNYGSGDAYMYLDNVKIKEAPKCMKPNLFVTGVSTSTVSVAFGLEGDYIVEIAEDKNFTTMVDSVLVLADTAYTFTGLPASTPFYLRALAVCDSTLQSEWSATVATKTAYGLPLSEDFADGIPEDWYRSNTSAASVFGGTAMNTVTSGWGHQAATSAYCPTGMGDNMKVNIYGTTCSYWLVTPTLDATDTTLHNVRLTFDAAWTRYNKTTAPTQTSTDDRFIVAISTDGGASWSQANAYEWNGAGTGNMGNINSFDATAKKVNIDLSQYMGGSITVGFYGESTVAGGDNDFHVANVSINTFNANCQGLDSIRVSDVSLAGATVNFWLADEAVSDAYIELSKNSSFTSVVASDTIAAGTTTYALTNLEPSTTYYVRIKQLCGEGEESGYTTANFTTNYGVRYAPVFTSTTVPSDWVRANGKVDEVETVADLSIATYGWSLVDDKNAAINATHFKANVYGASCNKWVITPSIDLSPNVTDGLLLSFDLALTDYGNTSAPEADKNRDDDRFMVLAIVGDSAIYKVAEWSSSDSADYVYTDIDSVATHFQLNFTEFAGNTNVRLAFYTESTVSGADDDIHVGNIVLDRVDAVNFIGDVCDGGDYDGVAEGNPFYIHSSEYKVGENHFSMTNAAEDTIYVLSLTVYPLEQEEYSATVCEGETYVDQYFNLGVVTLATPTVQKNKNQLTAHGCTKTVILNLTINPIQRVTEQRLLCAGSEFEWNGQTITTQGNYTFETTAATGCDSIITLQVKWDQNTEVWKDTTLTKGETMTLNDGTVISVAGSYDEEFAKESGCTHTIHWNVTYEETALDATEQKDELQKLIINDQLVIIRNGVKYTATGTRIE